ncbi:MAG: glycosyltransferase [Solirubrobacteraceae bacterium]
MTALGCDSWLLANSVEHRPGTWAPPSDRTLVWRRPMSWRAEELAPHRSAARRAGALRALLERVRPAVVHAHFGWSGADVWPACAAAGVPLVVTFHGSDATVYPDFRRRERWLPVNLRRDHRYAELVSFRPRVIAVSEFLAARLRALGFPGTIDIIPAGIRLEEFPYRPPRTAPPSPRLIFVGRLVPRKGLDVLLRALRRLPPALDGVRLQVIGDGPSRPALEALAAQLGLSERVRFAGALERPQMVSHLREADVLVMASRTLANGEAEGSPVVTKEALAVGLPFVATDCGGTRETFPPELLDEIVPENDDEALAARLAAVLGDPGDWPRRSRLGRRFAEERFAWRTLAERSVAVYQELAAGRALR